MQTEQEKGFETFDFPYKLNRGMIRRRVRAAYEARRLTAQHDDPHLRVCEYHQGPQIGDRCCMCAIGAALPWHVRIVAQGVGQATVNILVDEGVLAFEDPADQYWATRLQQAHDVWAGAEHRAENELKFLQVLDEI